MTSEQEAKLKRAKDIAARKALEAYGQEIREFCEKEGIELGSLGGDAHVHVALLMNEGSAVAVRSQWTFHDNPEILKELLKNAKKDGVA